MPFFQYKARDTLGKAIAGLVEAPDQHTAAKLLHDSDLLPISLVQTTERLSVTGLIGRFQRVSFDEIVNFTRQLATMIVAGLSIPDSLTILRTQTTNKMFSQVLMDIEHNIVGGGNLGDSLNRYRQYFSPIYIALVRAGESSGTLDTVLTRLANNLEAQREFRAKIIGAMVYPAIIIVGMVAVVFIMMTVVIPKLTDLYKDFGITLPWTTQLLISTSTLFVQFWWLMILTMIFVVWGVNRWRKTDAGEHVIDSFLVKIPLLGELIKKIILVEFTRTLAMLIASGIHIIEGLRILRDSLGNVLFREAIDHVAKSVEKGLPLGETFGQHEIFPPILSQMMKVGEETGKLDETLEKLSTYFQSESDHLVKGLTTAIEPIIMVILGVGVGFIVISIITPIYNLTSQIK